MNLSDKSFPSTPRISRGHVLAGAAFAAFAATVFPAVTSAQESTVPKDASLDTVLSAKDWLNGTPSRETLKGKVVLVDVFTFDCYNCRNITPNLRTLSRSQREGLAIVGIHSPETSFEHDRNEVVSHLGTLGVTWPVAVDNDFALWKSYNIEYWPTQMIFDRRGKLRKVVIGDSQDSTVDATITALLRETA
ncbi:MAG: thioredoxin-like domain-containing protein [Vulcanimicrobiaceae bacterium]